MDKKSFVIKGGSVDLLLVGNSRRQEKFFILALDGDKQVGYCDFWLNSVNCHISRIVVTDEAYLSRGVGHNMLMSLEAFCHKEGVKYICGFYIPRVYDNSCEITSRFYTRHGFRGDTLDDFCEREEICAPVHDRGKEYLLNPIIDDGLYDEIYTYNYVTCDLFSTKERPEQEMM